jgi:hypothetical protein
VSRAVHLLDELGQPERCPLTDAEVTAEQYLQFAARDLEDEPERGAVNGIGNAKRAVHQAVEALLQGYGLLARNRRASFPQKLALIDAAGLFSLVILNTLNLERNAVEHEYRVQARARASHDSVQRVIHRGWAREEQPRPGARCRLYLTEAGQAFLDGAPVNPSAKPAGPREDKAL